MYNQSVIFKKSQAFLFDIHLVSPGPSLTTLCLSIHPLDNPAHMTSHPVYVTRKSRPRQVGEYMSRHSRHMCLSRPGISLV